MKKFWVGLFPSGYVVDKFKSSVIDEVPTGFLLCGNYFERITGLKLKPGEIVQCELKVIKKG